MNATHITSQSRRTPEWFASWFDSEHYHTLYAHRSGAEAARFIDALAERGTPAAGATILDLGCGAGRHSSYLAAKGFDVTGLDLSAESLRMARRNERANLRFVRQDMRAPFGTDRFDCVLNLFTSFGYFDAVEDNLTVVQNIAAALRPGGTVVIDYLNVRQAERRLMAAEEAERGGVAYRITRWTDAGHIFKRIVVDDRLGEPVEFVERVAKLGLDDFRFMFSLCGITLDAAYGDYALAAFDPDASPRLIVVGRRDRTRRALLPPGEILPDSADGFGRHAEVRREHRLRDAGRD